MACDPNLERAELIHDVTIALAKDGVIENMDEAVDWWGEEVQEWKDKNLRIKIAEAIVDTIESRRKKKKNRALTAAQLIVEESKLTTKLEKIVAELAGLDPGVPATKKQRKVLAQEIKKLRDQIYDAEVAYNEKKKDKKIADDIKKVEKDLRDLIIARLGKQYDSDIDLMDNDKVKKIMGELEFKKFKPELTKQQEKLNDLKKQRLLRVQIVRLLEGKRATEPRAKGVSTDSEQTQILRDHRDYLSKVFTREQMLLADIESLSQQLEAGEFVIPKTKKRKELNARLDSLAFERNRLQVQVRDKINALRPKSADPLHVAGRTLEGANNFLKGMWASIDMSAVGRQGFKYMLMHPIRTSKNIPKMLKVALPHYKWLMKLGVESGEIAINKRMLEIEAMPNYQEMIEAGLEITELDGSLSNMEDMFQSKLAETIPGIRASNRMFTYYMNEIRIEAYNSMLKALNPSGRVSKNNQKAAARFVNIFTGRADLKDHAGIKQWGRVLNAGFFSYRYTLSHGQMVSNFGRLALAQLPGEQGKLQESKVGDKAMQMEIFKEYARLGRGMTLLFALPALFVYLADDDEISLEFNPLSSDFMKIRIHGLTLDMGGGMFQAAVLAIRTATAAKQWGSDVGPFRKTAEGEIESMSFQTYKEEGLSGLLGDYKGSKASPLVGLFFEAFGGGRKFGKKGTIRTLLDMPAHEEEYRDRGEKKTRKLSVMTDWTWYVENFVPYASSLSVRNEMEIFGEKGLGHATHSMLWTMVGWNFYHRPT